MSQEMIRAHFERLREEGDEMAWMMMVSFFNRHYSQTLESRREMMNQLRDKLPQHDEITPRLQAIGNKLLDSQSTTVHRLAKSAEAHQEIADLYMVYDRLTAERRALVNRLKAEREALKNSLAAQRR